MYYVQDIKELRLDENIIYLVKDSSRYKYFDCMLVLQADYIFLFKIIDKNILNNKICISKVDYFLNSNLIKTKTANTKSIVI